MCSEISLRQAAEEALHRLTMFRDEVHVALTLHRHSKFAGTATAYKCTEEELSIKMRVTDNDINNLRAALEAEPRKLAGYEIDDVLSECSNGEQVLTHQLRDFARAIESKVRGE